VSPLEANRRFGGIYCLNYSTLKIEIICSSETSVDFERSTWRYISEDLKTEICIVSE
jgi:hypothetical protein